MKEWLAAGKDQPSNFKQPQRFEVRRQILRPDFPNLADFPDIAHDATAIAPVMRKKNQHRKFAYRMVEDRRCDGHRDFGCAMRIGHDVTLLPARAISSPRCRSVS